LTSYYKIASACALLSPITYSGVNTAHFPHYHQKQYFYFMKRLLLIPALALILFACREKHTTTTGTPPAPDPNAFSTGHVHGQDTVSSGSGSPTTVIVTNSPTTTTTTPSNETVTTNVVVTQNGNTQTTVTTTTTNNNGVVTVKSDTVVTTVVMPDNGTATGTATATPTATGSGTADSSHLSRLVVSFYSIGAGINYDAKAEFDKWLAKDTRGGFTYTVTNWGREGEVNYCFNLASKSASEQMIFVKDVQKFLDGKEHIHVLEWAQCDKRGGQPVVGRPDPNVADTTVANVPDTNTARVVVSFISKGEGIDETTRLEFEQWLLNYGGVTWEITNWGREGEKNYCFRLANMDSRRQELFVRDVRTFMTDKPLVLVNEWATCDRRR
jgi:hypothetical protein